MLCEVLLSLLLCSLICFYNSLVTCFIKKISMNIQPRFSACVMCNAPVTLIELCIFHPMLHLLLLLPPLFFIFGFLIFLIIETEINLLLATLVRQINGTGSTKVTIFFI